MNTEHKPRPCKGIPGSEGCSYNQEKLPWTNYCQDCLREYNRKQYRRKRAAAGLEVYGLDEKRHDEAESAGHHISGLRRTPDEAHRRTSHRLLVEPSPQVKKEPIDLRDHQPSQILAHDIRIKDEDLEQAAQPSAQELAADQITLRKYLTKLRHMSDSDLKKEVPPLPWNTPENRWGLWHQAVAKVLQERFGS